MEMHQIRYFLAVCTERNFTRAAKLCHVSQPSLTRAIKLLEAELGGPLFRREHANSRLTELGEIVRPHLQEVWEQSYAAVAHAHEFGAVSRQRLKIGIMCTIAPRLLVDLMTRMRSRHASIEIQIVDGSAPDLQELLLDGQIGAGIYSRPEQKADPRLVRLPLFRERMQVAMPRHHRLADRLTIRIGDLVDEQWIRRLRCEFSECWSLQLRQHRIRCEMPIGSGRDDWALAMIGRGIGLSLMPQHSIDHPDVIGRTVEEADLWREVNLVTLKERPHLNGLGAFVQEATQLTWAADAPLTVPDTPSENHR